MLNIPAPSQFRKKPVVVSASQWFMNGDHPLDYSKTHDGLENGELRQFSPEERRANGWEGDIVRYYRHPDDSGERACQLCGNTMHMHGWIDTKEGGHIVCPGDWIITGVQGEHYPCKPYIFAETYEPASPLSAAPASAQEEAKDERQAFEAWHKREFGSYVPGVTILYNRWLGWEGRASIAAPAAGDALAWQGLTDAERDGYVGELVDYGTDFVAPLYSVVENIEKRLREKNAALTAQVPQQGEA